MLNSSVIIGRLVSAPELKQTSTGKSVTSFTVACDRSYVKQGEERQTDWIDCVAWNGTADFITRNFGKGSMIAVQGSIQTRSYEDKNGNRRKAVEIVVSEVSFCESKGNGSYERMKEAAAQNNTGFFTATDDNFKVIPTEDDLPF